MAKFPKDDLDEMTVIDARYARRIDRGVTLSGFDFPDIPASTETEVRTTHAYHNLNPEDEVNFEIDGAHLHADDVDESASATDGSRTLLTLPPEIRERIWRFVLGNLDNAPDSVQCRHCYPRSRSSLYSRPTRQPRLCFGLQSSVKAGKFPSILVLSRQTYGETAKLLYLGRSFVFCTWSCYSGWAEKLLARDKMGSEELLTKLREVTVHLDMQNGYKRSDTAKEWTTAVRDSIKQMFSKKTKVDIQIVEPTPENQLIVTEARLKFTIRETRQTKKSDSIDRPDKDL